MRMSRGRAKLRHLLETEFRDQVEDAGEGWRATRLPCAGCGRPGMELRRDAHEIALRCRWCDGGDLSSRLDLRAPVYARLVGGVQRPTAIQTRIAGWTRTYWSSTDPRCVRCDASVTPRRYAARHASWSVAHGWLAECTACGEVVSSSVAGLVLSLPEVREARRREPKLRSLPVRDVVRDGQPAKVVALGDSGRHAPRRRRRPRALPPHRPRRHPDDVAVLAVLRRRDFGLLWLAGLVSVAGDWVLMTALPYVVYDRTGSVLATAGMVAAQLAPSILLSSFAGVFVDRWDRRRVLVVANLLQALTVTALLLVGDGTLWIVYAVAAAQSAFASFSQPAESALLPTLVPRSSWSRPTRSTSSTTGSAGSPAYPSAHSLLAVGRAAAGGRRRRRSFLAAAALVAAMTHRATPRRQSRRVGGRTAPSPASGPSGSPGCGSCARTGRSRCCSSSSG